MEANENAVGDEPGEGKELPREEAASKQKTPSRKRSPDKGRSRSTSKSPSLLARVCTLKNLLATCLLALLGWVLWEHGRQAERREDYLTIAIMLLLGVRLVMLVYHYPKTVLTLASSWAGWLAWALSTDHPVTWGVITEHAAEAKAATLLFGAALYRMVLAWCYLIAPFLHDLNAALRPIWKALTPLQKAGVAAFCFFCYLLVLLARAVARNRKKLKQLAFQASFGVVCPAVWVGLGYVPERWLEDLLQATMVWIPLVTSIVAFHKDKDAKGTRMARMSLAFWSAWPALHFGQRPIQLLCRAAAVPSVDLQKALIILCLWLGMWEGVHLMWQQVRLHVLPLLLSLVRWVLPSHWLAGLASITTPTLHKITQMQSMLTWGTRNKAMAGGVALGVGLVAIKVLSSVSYLLTIGIWAGAGADTLRVSSGKIKMLYNQKLAFWILGQSSLLLLRIPVVGTLIGLWHPLLLALMLVGGELVLRRIIRL